MMKNGVGSPGTQNLIPGSLVSMKSLYDHLPIYVVEFIYRVA